MKNIKMFAIAALLVAVAVTSYSVSGTYAKYTTTLAEQTDSARVAKWEFNQTQNIANLFKASYDSDVNAPVDVVAPGTSGEYSFNLSGVTETNYTLVANVVASDTINTNTYAPIVYTLDSHAVTDQNADGVVDATDLAKAITALYDPDKVYAAGTVSESVHTIGWSWAIDGDNALDTALGNAIVADEDAHTVSLSVTITATQSELAPTA